ncbi:hypothetical protein THOM_0089 [Trachipleistophora hominis]|uniref:Uncharacterized protein n=1 Tax=Trachipleistophora hominis TaxID=72359 RepID=L7JZK1_TRAHO|nr:hypothetical protein THOM_0089 [Trachipleistophora hominis]
MNLLRSFLNVVLFMMSSRCGEEGKVTCLGSKPSHIFLSTENAGRALREAVTVSLRDGSKRLISLRYADSIMLMVSKLTKGFTALRDRMPTSDDQFKMFNSLEGKLSQGLCNKRNLNFREFVDIFSLTMLFPEPECFARFREQVDLSKLVKRIDPSRCEIDMQALAWYIEDMHSVARVVNSVCRYAFGVVSMCMRPEYNDLSAILPSLGAWSFESGDIETEKISLSESGDEQPASFNEWLERLSKLRKVIVDYLTIHDRIRLFIKLCKQAKEIEKIIQNNESDYNSHLKSECNRANSFADLSTNNLYCRERLFIHSMYLRDIYGSSPPRFPEKSEISGQGEPPDVLTPMLWLKKYGVLPAELQKSRKQFWEWREKKVAATNIVVEMGGLIDAINAKESAEFKAEACRVTEECVRSFGSGGHGAGSFFKYLFLGGIISGLLWRMYFS